MYHHIYLRKCTVFNLLLKLWFLLEEIHVPLNLVTTLEVLQTCYRKYENIKQFAKAILTTPVIISYSNAALENLRIERYTELIE